MSADWDDTELALVPALVPVTGMTKDQLAEATGLNLREIDQLIRDGLPGKRGKSRRDGWRFDLPAVFQWLRDNDPMEAAKQRKADAEAKRLELANLKTEGAFYKTGEVHADIDDAMAALRSDLLSIPASLLDQSEEVRAAVKVAIVAKINSMAYPHVNRD